MLIEIIEMLWGPAGRRYVAQGLWWGSRVDDILDCWCFGPGGWHGISLWFWKCYKKSQSCFSDPPTISIFGLSILRGGGRFEKSAAYDPRYSPMVSHGRHFFRLPVLRKRQAIEMIEMSGLVFELFYSRFQRGVEI